MDAKRILVVDDEQDLCEILRFNLAAAGYHVEVAYSAEEAMQHVLTSFHLILLDVMMPGMSGFELARMIKRDRKTADTPIIFLTAKDTEEDTLEGFDIGADDYITKPFSVREATARVRAVLHRSALAASHEKTNMQTHEGLTVDRTQKTVTVDGQPAELTKTEFELLWLLISHPGQVFSRQQLIKRVWPADVIVTDRAVDVNITRMRKKIAPYSACIATRQGYGYFFKDDKTSL